jgi:hypothetical protein
MATKIYKCLIASPGDTKDERIICEKVFGEINNSLGNSFDFRVEPLTWENNTRPSFGEYSQAVINEQIGTDYQLFLGIMYKKFGTPTKVAGSGTEEEFNNAYTKLTNHEKVEIMFYFNDEPPKKLSDIDISEFEKVQTFKKKVENLGGYYWTYTGCKDFEDKIRGHLNDYFLKEYGKDGKLSLNHNLNLKEINRRIFKERLDNALRTFNGQPLIWAEPVLSKTNDILQNPDENFNRRVKVDEILLNPTSTIIKAPPQFGLTCLAHHLILHAWEMNNLWIYVDSEEAKAHNIHNYVKREAETLGSSLSDVKCIVLDSWNCYDPIMFKKLKNLCDAYQSIPIYVMETIDDSKFLSEPCGEMIQREFMVLHLLALPRNQIRKVVSEYNKVKDIGDEDVLLTKVVSDLEVLNIHRTPLNCITLLKVSEKYFDESPVNRTNMIEKVLFILFNMDGIPTYKTKPDLKDCEYVLGRFCENLIRNSSYEFSKELFIKELRSFCDEKLIDLDVDEVFDILSSNNIIIKKGLTYIFRASYWIFYFAAKQMHQSAEFAEYIFTSKKYISFPEIIEFYTGIDRNRKDALIILLRDLKYTCDIVNGKVRLPENMNPFALIQWYPTEEQIEKVQNELSENVIKSGLPDSIKDQHADKSYNQIKPYNQSIQAFFEVYSLHNLIQNVKAASRALRNSDYVEPSIKKELLKEIFRSWEQIAKVLFALTPILASKGYAEFEGQSFELAGNFGDSFEEKVKRIIIANPTNIVGLFKDDIYSGKLGPLLYDNFKTETDPLKKHNLAMLFVFTRPREWKKYIEEYIIDISKNSFYLYDIVSTLRGHYRYDFASSTQLNEMSYLIKMGLAKHHFGDKKPGLDKIIKISNQNIPKRETDDNEEVSKE